MAVERYNDEFKTATVRQIGKEGYSVSSVANRLGVTTKSLYNWKAGFVKIDDRFY
jgi:transposase